MAHARQQIRDAIASVVNGGTVYGTNVFKMRTIPLDDSIVSGVCIYTVSENIQQMSMGRPADQRRQLDANIEAFAVGSSTSVFDTVDDIATEIEQKMANNYTLGNLVEDCQLVGSSTDVNNEGKKAIGTLALTYRIIYKVNPTNSEVILP